MEAAQSMKALGRLAAVMAIGTYLASANADALGLAPPGAFVLGVLFGPCLTVAVYAFRRRLEGLGAKHAAALAFQFVSLGAVLLTIMVCVQSAMQTSEGYVEAALDLSQRALDVSWDVFFGLGTICFAAGLARLSRLAFVISLLGGLTSVAFLSANLIAYPRFPSELGWPDLGPAMLGWYVFAAFPLQKSDATA